MRDLSLDDFSREVREKLRDKGVELPRYVVYRMTKAFFKHAEKTAKEGKERFILWQNKDIQSIYPIFDVKKLCNELADGDNVLTADYLIRINKMQKNARRYYKRMPMTISE